MPNIVSADPFPQPQEIALHTWLMLASAGSAVAAGGYLLVEPLIAVEVGTVAMEAAGGAAEGEAYTAPPIEAQGGAAARPLLFPVVLSLIPFFWRKRKHARTVTLGSAIMLLAFALLAGFSLGLFFFPSAAAMLAAAGWLCMARRGPAGRPVRGAV